ncbi:MAG: glutamate 5-kinase [Acidobacteria bacterium]|nr:glutamate 5-kinase [Acidobacteriota bacterium]
MNDESKLEVKRGKHLRAARRVVVKLGTSTVSGPDGHLCDDRVQPIVRSIAELMKAGRQVVLVSSGAVGLGRAWLDLHQSRLRDVVTKQACAAVGQSLLMDAYKRLFAKWEIKVAQVLLTEEDFTVWRRYSNLRHTIEKLLQFGVIPIINENDTVSTAEIASVNEGARTPVFSDNDRLAALVMSGLEAEALVLLSNVDGFLRRSDGEVIPIVDEITPEMRAMAAGPSGGGRGGMTTKLEAAEIAMQCGGTAVISNGQARDVLRQIFAGEPVGTAFLPNKRVRGKRRWIAFAADVQGRIVVDSGAEQAIRNGKASLLSSGVVRIESHFAIKDVVSIVNREGREIARGIAGCDSHEAEEVLAEKSAGKARARGAAAGAPQSRILVRRDNIVVLNDGRS